MKPPVCSTSAATLITRSRPAWRTRVEEVCSSCTSWRNLRAAPRNRISPSWKLRGPQARRLGRRLPCRAPATQPLLRLAGGVAAVLSRCRACLPVSSRWPSACSASGSASARACRSGIRMCASSRSKAPTASPSATSIWMRTRGPTSAAAPGWMSVSGASASPPGWRGRSPIWCAIFSRRATNRPALLTHDDVLTLFHEFGHGLHHLLTRVDYPSIAGINGVAWDAVELPSQFLENYAWHPEVLRRISSHIQTGAPLPADTQTKLIATRSFHAGLQMMRQLEFALFDFRLHAEYDPERGGRILEVLDERAQGSGGRAGARVESLPEQLRTHLRRWVRRRLLQLQVGRGARRGRLRRIRGKRRVRPQDRAALPRLHPEPGRKPRRSGGLRGVSGSPARRARAFAPTRHPRAWRTGCMIPAAAAACTAGARLAALSSSRWPLPSSPLARAPQSPCTSSSNWSSGHQRSRRRGRPRRHHQERRSRGAPGSPGRGSADPAPDGTSGWVKASYLSAELPLQRRLQDQTAQVEKLKQEVTRLQSQARARPRATGGSAPSARLGRPRLRTLRPRPLHLTSRARAVAPRTAPRRGPHAGPRTPQRPQAPRDRATLRGTCPAPRGTPRLSWAPGTPTAQPSWLWVVACSLIALVLGFVAGWRVLDRRIRRKYGGLRIY